MLDSQLKEIVFLNLVILCGGVGSPDHLWNNINAVQLSLKFLLHLFLAGL